MSVNSRRGDTLIEVLFSITIFSLVATITVNLMNNGVATAQKTLEVTMARNEIDAQAEALRFIQNSYLSEREFAAGFKQFHDLWYKLSEVNSVDPMAPNMSRDLLASINNANSCSDVYTGDVLVDSSGETARSLPALNAFVLNTRLIQPRLSADDSLIYEDTMRYHDLLNEMIIDAVDTNSAGERILRVSSLYPRIIYDIFGGAVVDPDEVPPLKDQERLRRVATAESIWVIAVQGEEDHVTHEPQFYDFHIRTCWHSVGRMAPSTIGTIVRLYNPDVVEGLITP